MTATAWNDSLLKSMSAGRDARTQVINVNYKHFRLHRQYLEIQDADIFFPIYTFEETRSVQHFRKLQPG